MASGRNFSNYPAPKRYEWAYKPPPVPHNPVFRGLVLEIGSSLVSRLPFLQKHFWKNAGSTGLRHHPELNQITPRYDPAVIPIIDPNDGPVENYTAPEAHRALPQDVKGRFWTFADYHEAYLSGTFTPSDVVEALLPMILRDTKPPGKHSTAFISTQVELVKQAAESSTKRYKEGKPLGLLDGVPIAIKDEVDLQGYKKTFGTKKDFTIDATSWCVGRLLEEGAICVGKTNMHELGLDTTNNNPNYGTPRNPYNSSYYTGGSSGGSAYTVASGLVPFALGADGGGSVRLPACYCGIYGLKPSHGRVSGRPTPSLCSTNGTLGPLANSMADLEVAYRVMARPDPEDPNSKLFAPLRRPKGDRPKLLGIYRPWFDRADPPVLKACEDAIGNLCSSQGYKTVDITLPLIHETQLAHRLTILSEVATGFPDITSLTAPNQVLIKVGNQTPAHDFLLAQKLRSMLMSHLAYLFQEHPGLVIVTPTAPNAGWHISGGDADLTHGVTDGNMTIRNMEYVTVANFAGCPALSAPVAYVDPKGGDGKVPVGLMGMGEWGCEDGLIEFGFDVEAYLNGAYEGGRLRPGNWEDMMKVVAESCKNGDKAHG